MPFGNYILQGHEPVPCPDMMVWANWFGTADRIVIQEEVCPGVRVSTVFLGINHQFGDGPPLLFETMIFGGPLDQEYQTRCSTWEEAEQMHQRGKQAAFLGRVPDEPVPPTWYERILRDED